ncbi:hypothetical protein M9H77_29180 [Catharanthus roseus]|uniref:Uncharacterized protein n=1 Tax=Catharanthus roseus TaxID=4058 RepID=A0ACC0AHF0_CATRO|nr:hypothetical protein M9H77_29180 [Catharanthus roseus]
MEMKKAEEEQQKQQQKKKIINVNNKYGDGVAWFRGVMLGKGSFGSVYLATLKNPRSKYSCLPPFMAVKSAEVSVSGSIQKEKEILSNVKGCPNIIRCYGEETTTGENGTMVYNLLLEYGSGGTLADRIKNSGGKGLSEFDEVRGYTKSLLLGLSYIHEIGYVHCDMKPENILLVHHNRRDGITQFRAKIGDFGLAKREQLSKKRKLEAYWRGTPRYMSPEAVLDNVQDCPSDIWALGCIVLEMLTGKPPWDSDQELTPDDILQKIGPKNEMPKIPNELSKEAKDFLKGCFVRKPRYRLTAEMLLNHPFVEGIVEENNDEDDDDGVEQVHEIQDINGIESVLVVSESDEDWGVASDEDSSFYYWSENDAEEEIEDEFTSPFNGEQNLDMDKNRGIVSSTILGAA